MATTAKTTTPKVTRPSRARAGTAKPTPPVPAATAEPVEAAPKLEETTVVVDAPAPVVHTTSAVATADGTGTLERKEGFVLEPMTPSKNYARFKVPEGIGCVPSTIYAPPDTKTVKILLIRES